MVALLPDLALPWPLKEYPAFGSCPSPLIGELGKLKLSDPCRRVWCRGGARHVADAVSSLGVDLLSCQGSCSDTVVRRHNERGGAREATGHHQDGTDC